MTLVDFRTRGPSLLDGYRDVVGAAALETLADLARLLRGHRVVMVSATSTGGVAETLHPLVRLMNELGVPTTWEVMPRDTRFDGISRALHAALQGGEPAAPSESDRDYFHAMNERAAQTLALDGDLIMMHDPPPAAVVLHRRQRHQHWVWRCHVGLSGADADAWEFLAPAVELYDAAVFSHVAFVPPLAVPAYLVPPSIDPLSDRNRDLAGDELEALLAPLGLPRRKPWVTQVSSVDRLEDPAGLIQAFTLARRRGDAHLVLAGNAAEGDAEGARALAEARERAGDRDDISLLPLPAGAHATFNALQRTSHVVVQESRRGGFAPTVSEALWKRRAVIASAAGGSPLQIVHERTGLWVRSVEGCAYQITRLLRSPELRRRLGAEGHTHVKANFLHPREARDYLAVFARLVAKARRAAA